MIQQQIEPVQTNMKIIQARVPRDTAHHLGRIQIDQHENLIILEEEYHMITSLMTTKVCSCREQKKNQL